MFVCYLMMSADTSLGKPASYQPAFIVEHELKGSHNTN